MRYRAFISYSHQDEAFAARLHERLERFRVPRRLRSAGTGARLGVIFRDRDELASSSSLNGTIRAALGDSGTLIVVCSEGAARSRWVDAEVELFHELHPDGQVLAVVAEDAPALPLQALLPPALRKEDEPLAADARADGDGRDRALLKLIASLIGVRFDDLRRRHAMRRRQRIAGVAAGTLVLLAVGGLLLGQAWQAQREAEAQKAQATALISYLVDDLDKRLQRYEEVGELDNGLNQALGYFGGRDLDELDDDTLDKYRVALIGVGSVRIRQGRLEEALASFQRAVAVSRVSTTRAGTDPSAWYELAQNTYYVGEAYWELQDIESAAVEIGRALDYARRAAALEPSNEAYRLEVIFALNNLGAVDTRLKRYAAATDALEASLTENEAMREAFPALIDDLLDQEVESVSWLAEIAPTLGHYAQAFNWHEREIALRESLFDSTGNVHHLARLADALGYYAQTLSDVGRTTDARATLARKVSISERLVREDPDNVFWQTRGDVGRLALALEVYHDGDPTEAVRLLDGAEAGLRDLLAEGRNRELVTLHLAYASATRAYFNLADPAVALGQLDGVFEVLEPRLDDGRPSAVLFDYYVRAVIVDSAARRTTGASPEAERVRRALGLMDAQGAPAESVRDAAALALLQLAAGDTAARATLTSVDASGYRAPFFQRMRTMLGATGSHVSSAAGERVQDHDLAGARQAFVQVARPRAAHEKDDVWPHLVLLVDHAEADARILAVEIVQQLVERLAVRLHPIDLAGVGEQGLRDGDLHDGSGQPAIPASTA